MLILAKIGVFDLHQLKRTPCKFFLAFHENLILQTKLNFSPYIYIGVKNICGCFLLAFSEPNIEKLAFYFMFMKGLKKKKKN